MQINPQGWHNSAQIAKSPNFNQRPENTEVSLIVVHNISLPPAQFGGDQIIDFFLNRLDVNEHPSYKALNLDKLEVSSHFLIRRTGGLVQFVSVLDRAWHAGQSSYLGQDSCNDFSIGIELEGTDDLPYEEAQYQALSTLCQQLIAYFPQLEQQHITGHEHIAPGRKSDPGPSFDWDHFRQLLCLVDV